MALSGVKSVGCVHIRSIAGRATVGCYCANCLSCSARRMRFRCLHVTATNLGPIGLYRELGFIDIKEFPPA